MEPYLQCRLVRSHPQGEYTQTVWVRKRWSIVGQRIPDDDGNVWKVAEVYAGLPATMDELRAVTRVQRRMADTLSGH